MEAASGGSTTGDPFAALATVDLRDGHSRFDYPFEWDGCRWQPVPQSWLEYGTVSGAVERVLWVAVSCSLEVHHPVIRVRYAPVDGAVDAVTVATFDPAGERGQRYPAPLEDKRFTAARQHDPLGDRVDEVRTGERLYLKEILDAVDAPLGGEYRCA